MRFIVKYIDHYDGKISSCIINANDEEEEAILKFKNNFKDADFVSIEDVSSVELEELIDRIQRK